MQKQTKEQSALSVMGALFFCVVLFFWHTHSMIPGATHKSALVRIASQGSSEAFRALTSFHNGCTSRRSFSSSKKKERTAVWYPRTCRITAFVLHAPWTALLCVRSLLWRQVSSVFPLCRCRKTRLYTHAAQIDVVAATAFTKWEKKRTAIGVTQASKHVFFLYRAVSNTFLYIIKKCF